MFNSSVGSVFIVTELMAVASVTFVSSLLAMFN